MADAKITALTELTSVVTTDLLAVVDDPSGTPITKKATVENVLAANRIALPIRGGAGLYHPPTMLATSNGALTKDVLYAHPRLIYQTATIVSLSVLVTSGVASSVGRLCVYSDDGGKPGTLLAEKTVSTAGGGHCIATLDTPLAVTAGKYWLASAQQAGASASATQNMTGNNAFDAESVPATSPYGSGPAHGVSQTGISGAAPDPWGSTLTPQQTVPAIWLEFS